MKREKKKTTARTEPWAQEFLPKLLKGIPFSVILIAVLVVSLAGYIFLKNVVFGVLAFIAIIALVLSDVIPANAGKEGIKSTLVEAGVALLAAVIAWFALGFVLSTSSPLDVVTSCSMLPALERGDLVVLQGGGVNAKEISFSGDLPAIRVVKKRCRLVGASVAREALCSSEVIVGNETISLEEAARNNDVIVFEPKQSSYGLVIHRAVLKLRNAATGEVLYLTKGDNNLALDQEAGIGFVSKKDVKGKVVFRVPYAGYVKLILFMQFQEPEGCGWRVETKA